MNQQKQEKIYDAADRSIREAQLQTDSTKLNQSQQEVMMQQEDRGMISEQLDLGEVLERIHNLLKGFVLKDVGGRMQWVAPIDNDQIILSEYGINYVMGAVQWYLNKNTLLSNYDDKQIDAKMEDLSTTMVDDIFMEYDKMFLYPTLEDCKGELKERIQAKVDVRKFALELMGEEVDSAGEKEIEDNILAEMEDRIEREMTTIREQKIKNKLKRFESIIRFVQDTIHSAYQRAWKGQERTTLRQHIHISETKGGGLQQQPMQQTYNPLALLRKR